MAKLMAMLGFILGPVEPGFESSDSLAQILKTMFHARAETGGQVTKPRHKARHGGLAATPQAFTWGLFSSLLCRPSKSAGSVCLRDHRRPTTRCAPSVPEDEGLSDASESARQRKNSWTRPEAAPGCRNNAAAASTSLRRLSSTDGAPRLRIAAAPAAKVRHPLGQQSRYGP